MTKRVSVFSLGGTIAMTPGPGGAVVPALAASDLVSAVSGLGDLPVELTTRDFRGVPGASLSFDDLIDLAGAIASAIERGAEGIVVTQGTDTIEETAFLLDMLADTDIPIVVTGAMRHPSMPGADGPANLFAAVLTAISPAAQGLGSLVAFSDEIHAARWVRKVHTTATNAFVSPNYGPIGHVIEQRVTVPFRFNRARPLVLPAELSGRSPRVELLTMALGDDGRLVSAAGEYADGLVIAGFGVGHVPAAVVPPLARLARRIPVVLASRTGAGPVHRATYGFAGSEKDLLDRGLISAGYLDPIKARLLLYMSLATGADPAAIDRAFAVYR
jgi:L-asparaginase